jgi:hypothetical protein
MLSNLSRLVSNCSSAMKKSNTLFNERRENLFKENIPAFSIQGKSCSVSVLQKNLPFVKAEADSVEYFVLCLKRSVRLH